MLKFAMVGLLAVFATTAAAQEPYETNAGRLCLENWITIATQTLNGYDGADDFNARKPWRVNRFGLFMGQKMRSNYEPDNWVQLGATRDSYMWNTYTSEERYPNWSSKNFRAARVPGLRYHVRACLEGAAPPAAGVGASGGMAGAGPAPVAVPPTAICPSTLGLLTSYPGVVLGCYCPSLGNPGSVWGSGPYTSDSNLCTAAVHAGVVDRSGGTVWATIGDGLSNYNGSSRFGVTTANWDAYGTSTIFLNAPAGIASTAQIATCPATMEGVGGTITCYCAPPQMASGKVWGTRVYTNDSSICRAALHAGMVAPGGGDVSVSPVADAGSYQGTTRNGVSTEDYGAWRGAFVFN